LVELKQHFRKLGTVALASASFGGAKAPLPKRFAGCSIIKERQPQ